MKVSRNSWHFKIHKKFGDFFEYEPRPKNLCKYFWATVFQVLVLIIISPFVLIGLIAWFCLVKWLFKFFAFGFQKIDEKFPPKEYVYKPQKEPGLVKSFVKAKKEKVCPMIELVD